MKSATCLGFVFLVAVIILWCALGYVTKNGAPHANAIKFGSNLSYSVAQVQDLIRTYPAEAAKYVYPGLFPLDLLLLACLGATIALFSIGLGTTPDQTAGLWMLLVLPVAYMLADLTENFLLAWLLTSKPEAIHNGQVTLTQSVTLLKLLFWLGGTLQVLWLLWTYWRPSH
jgi:hypothetical protein